MSLSRLDIRALRRPGLAAALRRASTRGAPGRLTAEVTGPVARIDARRTGYALARAGAWGPDVRREIESSQAKEPLAAALGTVNGVFPALRDGAVHSTRAPLPGPAELSAHIKSAARFLKADAAGVCELPQWAVYARDWARDPVVCEHRYAVVLISSWDYD